MHVDLYLKDKSLNYRMRSANWKSPKFWGGLALLAVAVTVMVVVLDIRSRLNQQDLSEINDIKTHVASINSSLNDVHTRINASTDQVDNVRERLDLMDSCESTIYLRYISH